MTFRSLRNPAYAQTKPGLCLRVAERKLELAPNSLATDGLKSLISTIHTAIQPNALSQGEGEMLFHGYSYPSRRSKNPKFSFESACMAIFEMDVRILHRLPTKRHVSILSNMGGIFVAFLRY
jgi:hypothetical protein